MSKRLKIHRSAVSLSTAVVMLNSILSMSAHAAGMSEFRISSNKSSVKAGEQVDVTVGLTPDTNGVSGFTLCLHYDPNEVSVYVPSSNEGGFGGDKAFTVVTNYNYSQGIVKIVGVDMEGDNITYDSILAKARFTVLDGAQGDIDYWLEVENIVRWDGDSYEYTSYSAPSASSPYSVDVETAPEPAVTETSPVTTAEELPVLPDIEFTAPEVPAVTEAPEQVTEIITETEEPIVISEETQQSEWYYDDPEPLETFDTEYTEPEYVEEITETYYDEPEYYCPEEIRSFDEPVFTYYKDPSDEDYTEEPVQYGFNASDYITDCTVSYDIKVYVSSTGYLNGVVGMDTDFGWDCAEYLMSEGGEQCWVYEDYDPNVSEDTVYMQVYYLSDYAGFDITGIEFVPRGEWYVPDETVEEVYEQPDVPVTYEVCENSSEEVYTDVDYLNYLAQADTPDESEYTAEPAEESVEESVTEEVSAPEVVAEEPSSTEEVSSVPESSAAPESTASPESKSADVSSEAEITKAPMREEIEPASTTGETSGASTPEKVLDKVDKAQDQAENKAASNSNPNTGSTGDIGRKMFKVIYYASIAYLVYAVFGLIYNRKRSDFN